MNHNHFSSKDTASVHAGTHINPLDGVVTPVYPSSAFGYLGADENVYPRYYNTANQKTVIDKLCALENAEAGLLFGSGMAAVSTTMLGLLKSGDHVLFQGDLYGGTLHFINSELSKLGVTYSFADGGNVESFAKEIRTETKVIYIETPSNPLLKITDIKAVANLAKSKGIITVIDNTFASPINQNPINLGIDVVLHSGTKYLGGHSDIIFGVVLTSTQLDQAIRHTAVNFGGNINGATAALIERSLKTLAIRVERQTENAMFLAEALDKYAGIRKVNYPGLSHHPGHEIAKSQMMGFGGMLSFEPDLNGLEETEAFMRNLKMIIPALSLGGVETLICSPAKTSHLKLSSEERKAAGIGDELLRLSVGIENPKDILADIEQALSAI